VKIDRQQTIRLVFAHVLIGPFLVGVMFIAGRFVLYGELSLPTEREWPLPPPLAMTAAFLKLSPIFYVPGATPAVATALLTARRVRSSGTCGLWRAAVYGAVTSAVFVGVPSLVFTSSLVTTYDWAVLPTAAGLIALQGAFGFVGTIPVWFATRGLRERIAARPLKPEAAA
jgi:hypothetical protein